MQWCKVTKPLNGFSTAGVTSTACLNVSPPATTRWATAVISVNESIIANRCNSANNICAAWFWSKLSTVVSNFWWSPYLMVKIEPGILIRSTRPLATTVSAGMANNCHFNDELPALIINVFAFLNQLPCNRIPNFSENCSTFFNRVIWHLNSCASPNLPLLTNQSMLLLRR